MSDRQRGAVAKPLLKAAALLLGILTALVVVGAAGRYVSGLDGTVTAKYHDESVDTVILVGKVFLPYTKPECWGLQIDDVRQVCVEKPVWDRLVVGDHFDGEGVE